MWHLPHAPALTGAQFLDLVNAALPSAHRTGRITPLMVRMAAPFNAMSRETAGVLHQWDRPFVIDDSAFREVFGFNDTPFEQTIATTAAAAVGSPR
ncbi:hypothetical protein BH23ACT9_BH23ACT9_17250 [soil metagenome]